MGAGTVLVFQWLLLLVFSILAMAKPNNNLPGSRRNLGQDDDAISSSALQMFYYNQTLDHFNFQPQSFATFPQRYMIDSTYWGGADKNAPIFVYLGNEMSLEGTLTYLGFLSDNAPGFKALIIYIEHRFYGKSVPSVSQREALKNETLRGYFNSAQALADYAELLLYLKKELSATYSPIIVVGASYGAMLTTWFRLKYPHIAVGALASSAQFLLLDDNIPQDAFYRTVFDDFQESSQSCSETIKASWDEIHKVASKPDGLSSLSQKFKTCRKLNNVSEIVTYLKHMYYQSATFDMPPTDVICRAIDGGSKGIDVLGQIFSGIVAFEGESSCYLNESKQLQNEDDTDLGLGWQSCSDLVFKFNYFGVDTSFPPPPFHLESYIKNCESLYGLPPRPYWMNDYFGVHDMKLVLKRFGSNIIFTSGLRDPWSTGGILEDISHSIVAIVTKKGAHASDVLKARKTDPEWLVKQRNKSLKIIEGWITKYYDDLQFVP
ncbi:lysosomal Pro-X carboxypeptidase-like [Ipomoea triloba]|uniref:lysosomal Pro-X carboxypeptidase-like n=1 Tax=Ipomoea triloba TaxID=35885 RepID=UPI00125DC1FB|nr:lysosomal Pro-X carboxypeptidase-like [Ipomoea triloba]